VTIRDVDKEERTACGAALIGKVRMTNLPQLLKLYLPANHLNLDLSTRRFWNRQGLIGRNCLGTLPKTTKKYKAFETSADGSAAGTAILLALFSPNALRHSQPQTLLM
jgi:hypothetical protein